LTGWAPYRRRRKNRHRCGRAGSRNGRKTGAILIRNRFALNEGPTYWMKQTAGLGMGLFFVLSGFVIHYNYRIAVTAGGLNGLSGFVWARFSRLYPLYLLILVLDVLLGQKLFHFMARNDDAFTDVIRALPYYLTFTQSWLYLPFGDSSLIYVTGTKCGHHLVDQHRMVLLCQLSARRAARHKRATANRHDYRGASLVRRLDRSSHSTFQSFFAD
jgi:hypothetical protein